MKAYSMLNKEWALIGRDIHLHKLFVKTWMSVDLSKMCEIIIMSEEAPASPLHHLKWGKFGIRILSVLCVSSCFDEDLLPMHVTLQFTFFPGNRPHFKTSEVFLRICFLGNFYIVPWTAIYHYDLNRSLMDFVLSKTTNWRVRVRLRQIDPPQWMSMQMRDPLS